MGSARASALLAATEPPSLEPFERALESYVAGIEEARRDRLTRVMSADAAE